MIYTLDGKPILSMFNEGCEFFICTNCGISGKENCICGGPQDCGNCTMSSPFDKHCNIVCNEIRKMRPHKT